MPKDKVLHFGLGICCAIGSAVGAFVLMAFGLGWFFAFSTTLFGIGYEVNQYVRKEGQVEVLDALATASPGWICLILLEFI